MRDTLFISHATPEDNEFAIWIGSRLEMLGYKVWIDKDGLLGGETFWRTIDGVIRNEAIKVLLIYSNNICVSPGILKDGIDKELSLAETIAKSEVLSDFIIPLNIDKDVPYNVFIGSNRLNQISFFGNWAEGLKQLLKKLIKDNVPKLKEIQNSTFSEWYENEYISKCSIISKKELYYSSWWQIAEMPQQFYIFKFTNIEQAKAIRKANTLIPISLMSNTISSFDKNISFMVKRENEEIEILPDATYSFGLTDVLSGFLSESFPQHKDVENHFKWLIRGVITNLFWKNGLWKQVLSNKRFAYFLPSYDSLKPVSFKYPFSDPTKKEKRKSIVGKFEDIGKWHYAVSFQPSLFPIVGFSLKSHLVFTSDGFNLLQDEKKVHGYRRKKGRRFFNEEWRDLQLAFIQRLKDNDNEIKIEVSSDGSYLKMKNWTEMFWSDFGYIDPSSRMAVEKIEDFRDEPFNEENND
ncbi:MAG TPA: toll/interleukin-1 receptor domain-containing protein [Paludibacter sp.]